MVGLVAAILLTLVPLGLTTPSAQAAEPTGPVITDLGALGRSGSTGWMNDKGQVAGSVGNSVNDLTEPVVFSGGAIEPRNAPGNPSGRAFDVDNRGRATVHVAGGAYGVDGAAFLIGGGESTLLAEHGRALGISETGYIVVNQSVRAPDGTMTPLGTADGAYLEVGDVDAQGRATGVVDTNPDPKLRSMQAFRSRPGQPVDVVKDDLRWMHETIGEAINEAGDVAGYGTENPDGGYLPVIWRDGVAHEQITSWGGMASDINEAGMAAGVMFDRDGKERAALFSVTNIGTDLNTMLPAGSPWVLTKATGINNRNQIAGVGLLDGQRHAFLLDLAPNGPTIESVALEHQKMPTKEWVSVPAEGTIDGNRVRISAVLKNQSDYPQAVTLEYVDKATGKLLSEGARDDILMPGETVTLRHVWDTRGFAWSADGKPQSERTIVVRLSQGGVTVASTATPVVVAPRPVILVHGYKSNAAASWGKYQPILSSAHPLLHGWAVGDDQVSGGRLNTGYPDGKTFEPFGLTNTIKQNAEQENYYIELVRRQVNAWHVDIVAHSMGGLMSRQYLQDEMPASIDSRPVVNRLIQLGTPNMGSPCADALLALSAEGALTPLMPATLQLSGPWVSGVFNQTVTETRGVPISNLVGSGIFTCGTNGDVVVPVASARWILEDLGSTGTIHTGMTESDADFADYVKPRLAQLLSQPAGLSATSAAADSPAAPPTFATGSSDVAAGETTSVKLTVPTGSAFGVVAVPSAKVGLKLTDPTGQVRAELAADEVEALPLAALSVSGHDDGEWTLEIANAGDAAVTIPFAAWVKGGPTSVDATADQVDDSGQVRVSATVTRAGAPVTGEQANAVLLASDGSRTEVTLTDDGAGSDEAADDGRYTGMTAALADGGYGGVVDAAGLRVAVAVNVKQQDRSPKRLTVRSQPGGSVAVSPLSDTYEYGAQVTLTAEDEPGQLHLGWVVDGEQRPFGPLTLTMDRDHTVLARFGSYTVTEIGTLPGGTPNETKGIDLNDAGQVTADVNAGTWLYPEPHAVLWQDGRFTDLNPVGCGAAEDCWLAAGGLNETGDVAATVHRSAVDREAVVLRRGGGVEQLAPGTSGGSVALDVNDEDQVFGAAGGFYTMWDNGDAIQVPRTPHAWSERYDRTWHQHLNARGEVAGEYVTEESGLAGEYAWEPAVLRDNLAVPLPRLAQDCGKYGGQGRGMNDEGVIVGATFCNNNPVLTHHAVRWTPEGKAEVLPGGHARADDINNDGLVVGEVFDEATDQWRPVLWQRDRLVELRELLPRGICPADELKITAPCYEFHTMSKVNASGQILAEGWLRDRRDDGGHGATKAARTLLLSPTTARADLAVTSAVSHPTPLPGSAVTWTSTVANQGNDPATEVWVDIQLPETVSDVTCETTKGECTSYGAARRVRIPRLDPGHSLTVTVTGTAPAADGTVMTARAHAFSLAVDDPVPGNDVVETTTKVRSALDRTGITWADAVKVGGSSHGVDVTVTNRTSSPARLEPVTVTGDFAVESACSVLLAVGESCALKVFFRPTATGVRSGSLTVPTSMGSPYVLPLTGTGKTANETPVVQPGPEQRGQVGKPFTLTVHFTDADVTDTHTVMIGWGGEAPLPAGVTEANGVGTATLTRTFDTPRANNALVIVTDSKGESASAPQPYRITTEPVEPANTAPVVHAGADVELGAGGSLDVAGSFLDDGSTDWSATVDYGDGSDPAALVLDGKAFRLLHRYDEPGTFVAKVEVRDNQGLVGSDELAVTVIKPNTVPMVDLTGPEGGVEGDTFETTGSFTDPDQDRWTATVDHGDGSDPEPLALDGHEFAFGHRYVQDGTYTVTVVVDDGRGGVTRAAGTVVVRNAAPEAVLTGPQPGTVVGIGDVVTVSASFTDAGSDDTHRASFAVGPLTLPGTTARTDDGWTARAEFVATAPGVHPVRFTVTDDAGASSDAGTVDGEPSYIVVVDRAAMKATGGGHVEAPAGSCSLTDGCRGDTGTVTFGFNVNRSTRQPAPKGNLQVSAAYAGLSMHSRSFTWATVSGHTMWAQGAGRLADGTPVTFRLTVVDGRRSGGTRDGARIQIWSSEGDLMFDNQRDAAPDELPQALAGGSVVIHR